MDPPSVEEQIAALQLEVNDEAVPEPVVAVPEPVVVKPDPDDSTEETLCKMPSQDPPPVPKPVLSDEKKDEQQAPSEATPSEAAPSEAAPPEAAPSEAAPSECEIQMPLSPKERVTSFEELRSYEAKRRQIYVKKLKSSSIYWRAFRDLLSRSYQETDRAETLMQGSIEANKAYAEYLQAAADDKLDYAGKPLNERNVKRFLSEKERKYSTLGTGSLLLGVSMRDNSNSSLGAGIGGGAGSTPPVGVHGGFSSLSPGGSGEEKRRKKMEASGNIVETTSFEGLPENSVLNSIIETHHNMAQKFEENYTFVKEVALAKTRELRKELESEVALMANLGDVTMYELERAEEDVQKAWAAYYTLASMNLGSSTVSPRTSTAQTNVNKNSVTDVWLVEMHYRMSVAYLTTIWEKCSAELSSLFASMKELECSRRFRLNELLILYMQRSERLWLSIPTMITSSMKDLISAPTDTDTIEKDVQATIRQKAQLLQKDLEQSTQIDPMNAPGLAGVEDLKQGYELQSPLMSDLLGKTEVVWKKRENIMSAWKPTLAVATTDSYLHLFDIPHYSNVQTGTAPEVAFQALVPPVKIPTENDIVNGNYPATGTNWYDHLIPTDSIDLKCAKITFNQSKGNSTFELTETLAPNKISSISNYDRKKRLALRMYSSQHMVEWLLHLKNYGAE